MNNKLFQWFYNMPKLTNQDNKDYMAKISLNIAVSLFLFNLVAVLISFFIVTTTENYGKQSITVRLALATPDLLY